MLWSTHITTHRTHWLLACSKRRYQPWVRPFRAIYTMLCTQNCRMHVHSAGACLCCFRNDIVSGFRFSCTRISMLKRFALSAIAYTHEHMRLLLQFENLVDPASSHMLVSKIKPCMCVYRFLYCETANCSLIQLLITWLRDTTWITTVIL